MNYIARERGFSKDDDEVNLGRGIAADMRSSARRARLRTRCHRVACYLLLLSPLEAAAVTTFEIEYLETNHWSLNFLVNRGFILYSDTF